MPNRVARGWRVMAGLLACLALGGCGEDSTTSAYAEPFTLPVGPTTWDATAPAWFYDGTLHVGDATVTLDQDVDQFVVAPTGAYWVRGLEGTLMFTSAEGDTRDVADVVWTNMAVSADRSVFATVDQSRGPTDEYGAHVMQLAVFDTTTGEQLFRTPDEEPADGDDLGALYSEVMPLLDGVGNDLVFYDLTTIDLDDGTVTPATRDAEYVHVYAGSAEVLFPDGYRINVRPRASVALSPTPRSSAPGGSPPTGARSST